MRGASAASDLGHRRHRHPRRAGAPRWTSTRADVNGSVVFVTFPAGDVVYGIQAVAANGAGIPQDEILDAARDLASKVGATP